VKTLRTALTGLSLVIISLTASLGFISPKAALADDPTVSTCTITPADLQGITAAEANGIQAELTARKALLTTVITCAQTEAQSLQMGLTAIQASPDAAVLQSQLSGKLTDAVNYYSIELTKVNDAGIAGTEAIAREVLSWRQGNYDPLSNQVANFILWEQNQDLFVKAGSRLGQMEGIVSFLEVAAQNNDLQNDLSAAQAFIQTANNENQSAKNALLQSAPSDESLGLIQQSLQSLADAYQKFSAMSTIAQTLLPMAPSTGQ
jgi:hypothetical protein